MADDGPLSIDTTGGVGSTSFAQGGSGSGPLAKYKNRAKNKAKSAIKSATTSKSSSTSSDSPSSDYGTEGSFLKGGPVKRTGVYKLHKGERVLNRKQTKRYNRKRSSK